MVEIYIYKICLFDSEGHVTTCDTLDIEYQKMKRILEKHKYTKFTFQITKKVDKTY